MRLGVVIKRLGLSWHAYQALKAEGRWMPEIRINARVVLIEEADVEAWKAREKARAAMPPARPDVRAEAKAEATPASRGTGAKADCPLPPPPRKKADLGDEGYGQ